MSLSIIILAAGQGTRMRSAIPKVLHSVAGKPMLAHVIDTAVNMGAARIIVVYGHGGEQVKQTLGDKPVEWVLQEEQHGTAHAVQQAMPHITGDDTIMILYGDVPLISQETLHKLQSAAEQQQLALLTAHMHDPKGYGRIIRNDHGKVIRIVEEKDASEHEKHVKEINTGFMAASAPLMRDWLSRIDNNNAQGEYYLTDAVALAVQDNIHVQPVASPHVEETAGVNNRMQLAELERYYQKRQAETYMLQGLGLMDPNRFDVRGQLSFGRDVIIDVNVVIEGTVTLGDNVTIGPNAYLRDAEIGAGTHILTNSVIEEAQIGPQSRIGPFARIRPGTATAAGVHIGNFVEMKKAEIGEGSKINHLSYVGDSIVGKGVNIGAGTITCNYDGAHKHQTVIEDNVFVGSDTQLIAPVKIGKGATIGAGSTISRDAPPGQLTLSRVKQTTKEGWQRPRKQKKPS